MARKLREILSGDGGDVLSWVTLFREGWAGLESRWSATLSRATTGCACFAVHNATTRRCAPTSLTPGGRTWSGRHPLWTLEGLTTERTSSLFDDRTVGVGLSPTAITAGRFDGDAFIDLVVTNDFHLLDQAEEKVTVNGFP